MRKIVGIDISKSSFDVCLKKEKWEHYKFSNDRLGFDKFLKYLSNTDRVLMEASGPYYVQLAMFLHESGVAVSVVNPLSIKRYSQMNLYRAKTDKKDAKTIAEYGMQASRLPLWHPPTKSVSKLKQLHTSLELLSKQIHQTKQQLSAFSASGLLDKDHKVQYNRWLKSLLLRKKQLENMMLSLAEEQHSKTLELLRSIPGVGSKTAMLLIAISDDFKKFSHHKQLIAYVGFSPRLYQSGTSIKGKGHICKMGKAQIRKLLYLCTWTAKKCNKACAQMYERLKAKGKPERVIKIALANKLLKQAFAIATKKTLFNENHKPNICF